MGFFKNRTARLFNESLMKAEQGIPEFQLIVADMYREGAGTVSNMQEAPPVIPSQSDLFTAP